MNHEMRLHPEPFEKIKNGTKTIEARLNDEKRKEFAVGDRIVFALRPDFVQKTEVEITELLHAPTFQELLAMRPAGEFATTPEELYSYYSKEDEQKYGVIGIRFKKI